MLIAGLLIACLAASVPIKEVNAEAAVFLLPLGILGTWRYGWAGLHLLRSLVYRFWTFPKIRRRVSALGDAGPSHVYLLLTSFRIDAETTRRVYLGAMQDAKRCGWPVTMVASLVELGDELFVRAMFRAMDMPAHVRLKIVRIAGTGKRDALAYGFRAIAADSPDPDAVVAVIDGDSILEEGTLAKCCPLFTLYPRLGALTTDEDCELLDGSEGIYRLWYSLRFAQRHILMSSVSLSRRVLTLTGRMSIFRAGVAADPSFIAQIETDFIDHPRLGRFRFLTGDDKSSWFWVLSRGWEMLYVPDVRVLTLESPPHPNFFVGSTTLMMRWFGNMLRTNGRALRVPSSVSTRFTRLCIIDQRISMWTSLSGLALALVGTVSQGPVILWVYGSWVLTVRYTQIIALRTSRAQVSPWWIPLLYYNQVYGSLIKIFIWFHLDRQKWTRQKTTLSRGGSRFGAIAKSRLSDTLALASVVLLVVGAAFFSGVLDEQDLRSFITHVGM